MSSPRARRRAWVTWWVTLALLVADVALGFRAGTTLSEDVPGTIALVVAVTGFATVGALIASRQPENRIGYLYTFFALAFAGGIALGTYAKLALDQGYALPFARLAEWAGWFSVSLVFLPFPFLFLLFPNGRVPTARWRWVFWLLIVSIGVAVGTFAVTPGPMVGGFSELRTPIANPLGVPGVPRRAIESVTGIAGLCVVLLTLLCIVSLVLRYRRARGDERQQIRWLMFVALAAPSFILLGLPVGALLNALSANLDFEAFADLMWGLFFTVLSIGLPVAAAIAILRYRLYELDVVVRKTVVAGLLAVFVLALYAATLGIIALFTTGRASSTVSFAIGVAAALALIPARRAAGRLADRLVYGKRATPYEVLTSFSTRVGETYSTEDILPRMAQILAEGTGAEEATVWLRVGEELRSAGSHPSRPPRTRPMPSDTLTELDGGSAFEVRDQGELLGALSIRMPASDPMTPAKERLARDLASQAGLVLRNARLIEEVRASRERLVAAQDEERRKIERDLHDGAQQQLVALAVKLRLLESQASKDPVRAADLAREIQADAGEALEDLRDLARGIYPPLLADKGLAAAIEAQARRAPVPVEIVADGIPRYPQPVEAAVYFSVLEALQNVAKYAEASHAIVRVAADDGALVVEVEDDGKGFEPRDTAYGTGLQGMADRLAVVGGALEVRSHPGEGTTISARVPVALLDARPADGPSSLPA